MIQNAFLLMDKGCLGAFDGVENVRVANGAAEADVLAQCVRHQEIRLEHYAQAAVQLLWREGFDGLAANADLAPVHIVLTHQKRQQRRFAAAGRADHAKCLPVPQAEGQIRHIIIMLVVGEADMVEDDMLVVIGDRTIFHLEVNGQVEDFFYAAGAGAALGVHDKDARNHEERIENDREVGEEGNDRARLRGAAVHAVGAHQNHNGKAGIEDKGGGGAHASHGEVGGALTGGQIVVDAAKVVPLVLGAGQRTDDTRARHVLLHLADHAVLALLHAGEEGHALPGGPDRNGGQQGQRGDQHQRQHRLQEQGHDDAAHQQHGRADADALKPVDHVVHIVGIRGQAGDEGGVGHRILLGCGQGGHLAEQVKAHFAGDLPGHIGGHAVGAAVAQPGQDGANDHGNAHQPHAGFIAIGRILIQDDRQHPRQEQLDHRAGNFHAHLQRDAPGIGSYVLSERSQAQSPPLT